MHCWTPAVAAATEQATALGKTIELVLADAGYFAEANLVADGPDRLVAPGKNRDVILNARAVDPSDDPPPAPKTERDRMRQLIRQPENAEQYKRRSATVEPVIAHLKEQTRLKRFARRGVQAATAELNLAAAVVNLLRLHTARPATG